MNRLLKWLLCFLGAALSSVLSLAYIGAFQKLGTEVSFSSPFMKRTFADLLFLGSLTYLVLTIKCAWGCVQQLIKHSEERTTEEIERFHEVTRGGEQTRTDD
mgnify:CR=1 FL=1